MQQPIVLCGLGRMGSRVLDYLRAAHMPVVVVDNQCQPDDEHLQGGEIRLVQGDCRSRQILEQAGVASAQGVLILTSDDLVNIITTLQVRSLNPEIRVVLRLFDQNLIGRLGHAIHNVYALSTAQLTAPTLAMTAMTGQAIGAFRLEDQPPESTIRDPAHPRKKEFISRGYLVAEVLVEPGSDLQGRSIEDLSAYPDVTVLGHLVGVGAGLQTGSWRWSRRGRSSLRWSSLAGQEDEASSSMQIRLLGEVDQSARLKAGDRLIICGEPRALTPLLARAEDESVSNLIWAHWLRRWGRVIWRTLSEIDRAVLICASFLIIVLTVSTLILYLGVKQYRLGEALFRTVSVMATMTGMSEGEFKGSEWQDFMEVYVAGLRIVGATLMAAFTAIVTNYLLRARMSGALEVRRIPDQGHILVCGLGSIGYLVVEELLRYGERPVVIERDAGNRFVTTARRLGVPVIAGDAGVSEVMRQAHASEASAVVAATSNDLINLAVALQAREANPMQRVVLLLNDPELARMLREGAGVELAVSVPKLAAPAFLAGLFGDRVQTVFLVRQHLLTVIDLVCNAYDPFQGRVVRGLATDYKLYPIALLPARGSPPEDLASARLSIGDRLVAVVRLSDLERLLRRESLPLDSAVEVAGCPVSAREMLLKTIRDLRNASAEEAEHLIARVPFRLADRVTRGQAEDLVNELVRQRVTAYRIPLDEERAS
jgi:Trk K+ transport system NAD-binding subunit